MNRQAEAEAQAELDILLHLDDTQHSSELGRAAIVSIGLHVVLLLLLPWIPLSTPEPRSAPEIRPVRQFTKLIAPPREEIFKLTQKAPNVAKPADEVDLQSLLAHKKVVTPRPGPPANPA